MEVWGVVVAGGSGARYGSLKQLEPLGDRRVIDHAVKALVAVCSKVVVVVPSELAKSVEVVDAAVVSGGATRSESVRAGLAALEPSATHVLVHDAARPLASAHLVHRVVEALDRGAAGVVPVVPVTDTLRTVDGQPVDRSTYVAVQTPQGFDLEVLRRAHESGHSATDDAALLDRIGAEVVHVAGDATNVKITDPHDLAVAKALLCEASR